MTQQNSSGTALVTGASSGIGAVYAQRLASRGYNLVLVARDVARLESAAAVLRARHGVTVDVMQADLSSKQDLLLVELRLRTDEHITLLVNNAGMATDGTLAEGNLDQIDTMIALNVGALTRLASAAAAAFIARGRGIVVNIGSVVALAPEMFNASYSATKAYVLSLSESLHAEVSKHGVQVQVVLPGVTRTEIWERSGRDPNSLPAQMIMEAGDLVDAALAGMDAHELVTIPSLPNPADWRALAAARAKLGPNLSHNHPAARYGLREAVLL
ncbi:MAG: SDR family oxidoreductase [Pseudomonadota bacterium]